MKSSQNLGDQKGTAAQAMELLSKDDQEKLTLFENDGINHVSFLP